MSCPNLTNFLVRICENARTGTLRLQSSKCEPCSLEHSGHAFCFLEIIQKTRILEFNIVKAQTWNLTHTLNKHKFLSKMLPQNIV